jgi:Protein of unknown function (DUF3592)
MERRPRTGWYNRLYEWTHERPLMMAIWCTVLTLFLAWVIFDHPGKSDFYAVKSFALGLLCCLCAVHYFKVAYHQRKRMLTIAATWPAVDGYIAQVEEKPDHDGLIVTLAYTYEVDGERHAGRESFPFGRDEDAARFENGFRERTVKVHYRPDKPHVSVLDLENTRT